MAAAPSGRHVRPDGHQATSSRGHDRRSGGCGGPLIAVALLAAPLLVVLALLARSRAADGIGGQHLRHTDDVGHAYEEYHRLQREARPSASDALAAYMRVKPKATWDAALARCAVLAASGLCILVVAGRRRGWQRPADAESHGAASALRPEPLCRSPSTSSVATMTDREDGQQPPSSEFALTAAAAARAQAQQADGLSQAPPGAAQKRAAPSPALGDGSGPPRQACGSVQRAVQEFEQRIAASSPRLLEGGSPDSDSRCSGSTAASPTDAQPVEDGPCVSATASDAVLEGSGLPSTLRGPRRKTWSPDQEQLENRGRQESEEVTATHSWNRGETQPAMTQTASQEEEEDQMLSPRRRVRLASQPAPLMREDHTTSMLEGILADCEARLEVLGDILREKGATDEWKADVQLLQQIAMDLAAEALESGCKRTTGAMEVFEGASKALEAISNLVCSAEAGERMDITVPRQPSCGSRFQWPSKANAAQPGAELLSCSSSFGGAGNSSPGGLLAQYVREIRSLQEEQQAGGGRNLQLSQRSQSLMRSMEELSSQALMDGNSDLFQDVDAAMRALTGLIRGLSQGPELWEAKTFESGSKVEYNSATYGGWVKATVMKFDLGSNVYDLDVKKGVPADKLRMRGPPSRQPTVPEPVLEETPRSSPTTPTKL